MKKHCLIIIAFALFFFVVPVLAQGDPAGADNAQIPESFEAEVLEVLDQKEFVREDGARVIQQNLRLKALNGPQMGQEFASEGISEIEVANAGIYKKGDRVLVQHSLAEDGLEKFYVADFVRRGYLYLLAGIFSLLILVIGRNKGLRSLISLIASFFVIIRFILPQILAGANPLAVGLVGALLILALMIYFTEGWNRKSHLAVLSVLVSLGITLTFSWLFVALARLSGLAQEESVFLIGLGRQAIDFRGLLLAGMLIGAIGVLDDVIVSQLEAVRQIKDADPRMSRKQVFQAAFKIGNTHLGTMVNTLFLTYAGASLPLLLLFTANQGVFVDFSQALNNEAIATEVVRTLAGSIGVALSMPIATALGAYFLPKGEYGDDLIC